MDRAKEARHGAKAYEADDPLAFVAVETEPDPGVDHLEAMAAAFTEEFLRMGWTNERILALFRNPFFRGPHAVYAARGEAYVRDILGRR